MVSPTMGVSPELLAQAQEVGRHVRARVVLERRKGAFTVVFAAAPGQGATGETGALAGKMVEGLVSQLYQFFGIQSEVEDVG